MSQDDLQILINDVDGIKRDMGTVKAAIVGNREIGHEGLVARVQDLDRRMRLVERLIVMFSGAVALISVVAWANEKFGPIFHK